MGYPNDLKHNALSIEQLNNLLVVDEEREASIIHAAKGHAQMVDAYKKR